MTTRTEDPRTTNPRTADPITYTDESVPVPPAQVRRRIPTEPATNTPASTSTSTSDQVPVSGPVPKSTRKGSDRILAKANFVEKTNLVDGDPRKAQLRRDLVEMHLPLAEFFARKFTGRGENTEDLVQVATVGLIKAVDRFDPARGVEFSSYAAPTIIGEIKRHFRDKSWAVRVPRRLQELRLALTKATAEMYQDYGRAPTVKELATRLELTEEEIVEGLESGHAYTAASLDTPTGDDEGFSLADQLGTVDAGIALIDFRESLKPLLAALDDREKRILTMRFFEEKTQSQIAIDLGISQMHVSRILARTLAKLRAELNADEWKTA